MVSIVDASIGEHKNPPTLTKRKTMELYLDVSTKAPIWIDMYRPYLAHRRFSYK